MFLAPEWKGSSGFIETRKVQGRGKTENVGKGISFSSAPIECQDPKLRCNLCPVGPSGYWWLIAIKCWKRNSNSTRQTTRRLSVDGGGWDGKVSRKWLWFGFDLLRFGLVFVELVIKFSVLSMLGPGSTTELYSHIPQIVLYPSFQAVRVVFCLFVLV